MKKIEKKEKKEQEDLNLFTKDRWDG